MDFGRVAVLTRPLTKQYAHTHTHTHTQTHTHTHTFIYINVSVIHPDLRIES